MNGRMRLSRGRADPFGLLVLAVMLALTITIGIQAQASVVNGGGAQLLRPTAQLQVFPVAPATEPARLRYR